MSLQNWWRRKKRSRKIAADISVLPKSNFIKSKSFSALVVIACLVFGVALLLRSNMFLIRSVNVTSINKQFVDPEQVKTHLQRYQSMSIFQINPEAVNNEVRQAFLPIASVTVERQLPDALNVTYSEYVPILELIYLEQHYLVEQTGLIYAKRPDGYPGGLPAVEFKATQTLNSMPDPVGQRIPSDVFTALSQITQLDWPANNMFLQNILWFDQFYELICLPIMRDNENRGAEPFRVRMRNADDLPERIAQLQVIINDALQQNKKLELVDLRFEAPVVRYLR